MIIRKWTDVAEELKNYGFDVEFKGRGRNEIIAVLDNCTVDIQRFDQLTTEYWVFDTSTDEWEITINKRVRQVTNNDVARMFGEAQYINDADYGSIIRNKVEA